MRLARTRRISGIALLAVLFILPSVGTAMESTCAGCVNNCCEWAFSASSEASSRAPSIDAYSRYVWERQGYDPSPCRDVLHDAKAYQRCVTKAFGRCNGSRCKGCGVSWVPFAGFFKSERTQIVFYPGQIISIEGDPGEDTEPLTKPAPVQAPGTRIGGARQGVEALHSAFDADGAPAGARHRERLREAGRRPPD